MICIYMVLDILKRSYSYFKNIILFLYLKLNTYFFFISLYNEISLFFSAVTYYKYILQCRILYRGVFIYIYIRSYMHS
jgi:hypothetical protein